MTSPGRFLLPACIAMALGVTACGSDGSSAATTLKFRSDLIEYGSLAVPRDPEGGMLLGIDGKDASGAAVTLDADTIECTSSDEAVVSVIPLGSACIITGMVDRFDAQPGDAAVADEDDAGTDDGGTPVIYDMEPEAVVTAKSGDARVSLTVRVVVNAEGTWKIEAAGMADEITFRQVGRQLFIDGTNAAVGGIQDDHVTVLKDGLTLEGTLSARDTVSGMVGVIAWTAKKDP